jgi:phosphoserine phosphatase RsbU/P
VNQAGFGNIRQTLSNTSRRQRLRRPNLRISTKLIAFSTLLIAVVVGVYGVINRLQSRRIIDEAARRLQGQMREGLQRAGSAQAELLATTARTALVQNDYGTLQSILQSIVREDERLLSASIIDTQNTILADSDAKRVGSPSPIQPDPRHKVAERAGAGGQRQMVIATTIEHEGTKLGHVVLVYSLASLEAEMAKAEQLKRDEVTNSLRNTLVVGGLSILLGFLLAILQGLRISRPIEALARQAEQIASGDLQARVSIRSRDEIGLLGDRFNYMAEQVINLLTATGEKAAMEKELEVASAVQSTLVPSDALTELPGLQLAGFFRPAARCGGDWWSYYHLENERVLLVIGDVTGHGVGSAMITAAAKGAVTTLVTMTGGKIGLDLLLQTLNAAIHDTARGKLVMTCFASIYDRHNRTLSFANAGHNFPYVHLRQENRLISLVVRGNRLGEERTSGYEVKEMKLSDGDTLFWYTDGLVEGENARGEEYSEKRFRAAIQASVTLPPQELRDQIVDRAMKFYGGVPQKDDITLVVGRVVS